MKVKLKVSIIANVEGKSVSLKEGDVVDLPREAADNLLSAGYAVRATEPVTVIHKRGRSKAR